MLQSKNQMRIAGAALDKRAKQVCTQRAAKRAGIMLLTQGGVIVTATVDQASNAREDLLYRRFREENCNFDKNLRDLQKFMPRGKETSAATYKTSDESEEYFAKLTADLERARRSVLGINKKDQHVGEDRGTNPSDVTVLDYMNEDERKQIKEDIQEDLAQEKEKYTADNKRLLEDNGAVREEKKKSFYKTCVGQKEELSLETLAEIESEEEKEVADSDLPAAEVHAVPETKPTEKKQRKIVNLEKQKCLRRDLKGLMESLGNKSTKFHDDVVKRLENILKNFKKKEL